MTHVKQSVNGASLITPDLIEKAATAIELAMWNEPSSEALARAALQAVLPDVVEACAKAAEAEDPYDYGDFPEAAAARIRSLLNKEDNANG